MNKSMGNDFYDQGPTLTDYTEFYNICPMATDFEEHGAADD